MTHILSFISGSDLSPLMLSGGATLSNPGEGFADLVGSIKLTPANPDAPTPQAPSSKTPHGIGALLANEADLSLPNTVGANLLSAAGHSQAEATKLSLGIRPEMRRPEGSAIVAAEVASSDPSLKMRPPKVAGLPVAQTGMPVDAPTLAKRAVDQSIPVSDATPAESEAVQVSNPLVDRIQPAQAATKNSDAPIPEIETLGARISEPEATAGILGNSEHGETTSASKPASPPQAAFPVGETPVVEAPADDLPVATEMAADQQQTSAPLERSDKPAGTALAANSALAAPTAEITSKQPLPSKPERAPAEGSAKTRATNAHAIPLEVAQVENRSPEAPLARAIPSVTAEQPQSDFAQRLSAATTQISGAAPAEGGNAAVQQASAQTSDSIRLPNHAAVAETHLAAKPGQMGKDLAVQIARHSKDGQDTLTIRLDPAELGRINVRMHFDDQGSLRAHVTAESNLALDMLRRESIDLARALTDAGVRNDAQSFRFDSRGQEGGQQGHRQAQHHGNANDFADHGEPLPDETEYRRVRTNGAVDVLA